MRIVTPEFDYRLCLADDVAKIYDARQTEQQAPHLSGVITAVSNMLVSDRSDDYMELRAGSRAFIVLYQRKRVGLVELSIAEDQGVYSATVMAWTIPDAGMHPNAVFDFCADMSVYLNDLGVGSATFNAHIRAGTVEEVTQQGQPPEPVQIPEHLSTWTATPEADPSRLVSYALT